MFKKTDSKRSTLYAGFAGVAALALLTACGGGETAPEEEPTEPGGQEDPAQQDPTGESPAEEPMESPGEGSPMGESPGEESPMGDSPAEEGEDVEGAGENDATSTLGFVGNTVSWAL